MQGIEHLDLMPEPDEPSLLTTVDSDAPGYPGEAYGVSDEEAREMRWPAGPIMKVLWPWGGNRILRDHRFAVVDVEYHYTVLGAHSP